MYYKKKRVSFILILLFLSSCHKEKYYSCEYINQDYHIKINIIADYKVIKDIIIQEEIILNKTIDDEIINDLNNQGFDDYLINENSIIFIRKENIDKKYHLDKTIKDLERKHFYCE